MTSEHVFVAASGFGKRVIPNAAPYRLSLESGSRLIVGVGDRTARIAPEQSVTAACATAADVADVTAGPDWPARWLETHPYRVPLPEGWTAYISGQAGPAVFDLVGPHDSLIFVQTPRRVPPLDQMVAPGQEQIGRGSFATSDWVDCKYTEAGIQYVQRHALVRAGEFAAVVTLQSQADAFALAAPIHEFVADSLQPGEQLGRSP